MRYIVALIAILAGLLAGPLFATWAPNVLFPIYMDDAPDVSSLEHITEASQSIRDVAFAVFCLFVPVSFAAQVTPGVHNVLEPPSLPDVLFSNRIYYDGIVHEAVITDTVRDISSLAYAVDLALGIDDWILLHEDGMLALRGIGNVPSHVTFATGIASLSLALSRIHTHIELSIARAAFMQRTLLIGLSALSRFYPVAYLSRVNSQSRLARVAQLCTAATSDSAMRTNLEIQGAMRQVSQLRSTVDDLVRGGDEGRLCAIVDTRTCAQLAPLYRGKFTLAHVLTYLMDLEYAVNEGLPGTVGEKELPLYHDVGVLVRLVEGHIGALEEQLFKIGRVRKAMVGRVEPGVV